MLTFNITSELEQRNLDRIANPTRVEDDSDFFLELSHLANVHAAARKSRGQSSAKNN